jgi:hypothetical protein
MRNKCGSAPQFFEISCDISIEFEFVVWNAYPSLKIFFNRKAEAL